MSSGAKFALVFITFTALIWVLLILVAFWAYRNGQFSDQDRARYLALRSGPPLDEDDGGAQAPQGRD